MDYEIEQNCLSCILLAGFQQQKQIHVLLLRLAKAILGRQIREKYTEKEYNFYN